MQCPICNGEMITGDIVCKTGAGPTFYPRKAGETELKHICRMFFGSRESKRMTLTRAGIVQTAKR